MRKVLIALPLIALLGACSGVVAPDSHGVCSGYLMSSGRCAQTPPSPELGDSTCRSGYLISAGNHC